MPRRSDNTPPSLRRRVLSAATLLFCLAALASPVAASADRGRASESPGFARAQAALDRLGDRLPDVAQQNGMTVAQFRSVVLNDTTVAIDGEGNIAYFDVLAPGEVDPEPVFDPAAAAPPTTSAEFQLASLPGAEKTIYLDFDGHVTEGTTWNNAYGVTSIVSPAYDTDGDPTTWSATELDVIRRSWAVVAEDFAPWNVNVTTIDPGTEALRRSGTGDTEWGARVVITADTFANCGCGGHAYIGAFDDSADEPTFVYNSSFNGVSEAITHEVGHMLGLAHDGIEGGASYYTGHDGGGVPGWAPIMGVAYYQPVGQWSQQEYAGANNNADNANYGRGPDDVAIISSMTNGNNFGVRVDDVGDTRQSATPFVGPTGSVDGLISTRTDVDVFSFNTVGGEVQFTVTPKAADPNVDLELRLFDARGALVSVANPQSVLEATLVAVVDAGDYFVQVDGVGAGDPSTPTGYSDYASLGEYQLTYSVGDGTPPPPPDTEPPAAPTGLSASAGEQSISLTWAANTEADLGGYLVFRSDAPGAAPQLIASVDGLTTFYEDAITASGIYEYTVVAEDLVGNRSTSSAPASATIELPMFAVASSDLNVRGVVDGAYTDTHVADGVSQVITEVSSGGKPSQRHDLLEHQWAFPSVGAAQTITIVASVTDGGDADNGVRFEWSTDQSSWVTLTTVPSGATVTSSHAIGATTGTVWVRVVDTDRSARQQSADRVAVDLLRIDGEELGDPTQTLVSSFATGTPSAGRGQQRASTTIELSDDLGQAVSGAQVTVRFSGSFDEVLVGTTDGSGRITFTTSTSTRKPSGEVCIVSIVSDLPAVGAGTCRSY